MQSPLKGKGLLSSASKKDGENQTEGNWTQVDKQIHTVTPGRNWGVHVRACVFVGLSSIVKYLTNALSVRLQRLWIQQTYVGVSGSKENWAYVGYISV